MARAEKGEVLHAEWSVPIAQLGHNRYGCLVVCYDGFNVAAAPQERVGDIYIVFDFHELVPNANFSMSETNALAVVQVDHGYLDTTPL